MGADLKTPGLEAMEVMKELPKATHLQHASWCLSQIWVPHSRGGGGSQVHGEQLKSMFMAAQQQREGGGGGFRAALVGLGNRLHFCNHAVLGSNKRDVAAI